MPREFGQVDSMAWRDDDDWRALPADAQWLYMLLVSQSDLSAAGVLTLAINRWQRMCADMGPERFTLALAALESQRFVFVDYDDLELLIRTYARSKTQWSNPRRVAAVKNAAAAIHSTRLRRALAVDLTRGERSVEGLPPITPQMLAEFSPEGTPERLAEPYAEVSAERSPLRFRGRACQTPDAISQTPDAQTPLAPASPPRGRRRDELWEAVMAVCAIDTTAITDSARGGYNKALAEMRGVKATPDEVVRRSANYRVQFPDAALTPTALAKHWAQCDAAPVRVVKPTTDDRVAAGLDLAHRLAREGR